MLLGIVVVVVVDDDHDDCYCGGGGFGGCFSQEEYVTTRVFFVLKAGSLASHPMASKLAPCIPPEPLADDEAAAEGCCWFVTRSRSLNVWNVPKGVKNSFVFALGTHGLVVFAGKSLCVLVCFAFAAYFRACAGNS